MLVFERASSVIPSGPEGRSIDSQGDEEDTFGLQQARRRTSLRSPSQAN